MIAIERKRIRRVNMIQQEFSIIPELSFQNSATVKKINEVVKCLEDLFEHEEEYIVKKFKAIRKFYRGLGNARFRGNLRKRWRDQLFHLENHLESLAFFPSIAEVMIKWLLEFKGIILEREAKKWETAIKRKERKKK